MRCAGMSGIIARPRFPAARRCRASNMESSVAVNSSVIDMSARHAAFAVVSYGADEQAEPHATPDREISIPV